MAFGTGRKVAIGLALASAFALGGCYDDGYGYGGVNAGYGYYDDGYYGGGYYGGGPGYYAGGYGYPGYGWYNGFYYPGSGYYVYDRGGNRRRWNDDDRRHWDGRRGQAGFGRGRGDGRPGDGRPGDGRPGDGRPGDGRPGRGDGQWAGRPGEGRPDGQPGIRPDGTPWQGREGWRGNRGDQQNADRGQNGFRGRGMWGGGRQPGAPQVGRSIGQAPQGATPTRAPQSFRNEPRGGRGGRGNPQR